MVRQTSHKGPLSSLLGYKEEGADLYLQTFKILLLCPYNTVELVHLGMLAVWTISTCINNTPVLYLPTCLNKKKTPRLLNHLTETGSGVEGEGRIPSTRPNRWVAPHCCFRTASQHLRSSVLFHDPETSSVSEVEYYLSVQQSRVYTSTKIDKED